MTQGTKAESQMMNTFAPYPMPNHKMAREIQAMGGMGRRASNRGRAIKRTVLYQPMSRPRGTPTSAARPKPPKARLRLVMVWAGSVAPSGAGSYIFSINRLNTSDGGTN